MRSRLVLAAKTLVGVLIALDWWYFVSVEVASSPLNTYNTVGFLPRVVVSLAYLAWLLWPLRRVGWSQPRVDIEPDRPRDIRGEMIARHGVDFYGEATEEEASGWISGDDADRGR